jgi:hypothetical protein
MEKSDEPEPPSPQNGEPHPPTGEPDASTGEPVLLLSEPAASTTEHVSSADELPTFVNTTAHEVRDASSTHAHLFFRCFAMVIFFDRAVRGTTHGWLAFAITCTALFVVVNPRSRAGLLALTLSHVVWFTKGYKNDAMVHWLIGFLGNATFLLAVLLLLVRSARARRWPTNVDVFRAAAPAIRMVFFIGLVSAGFAKMNGGFLNPKLSCGALYYLFQTTFFPFTILPTADWAQMGAISFTVVAEFVAPFFLLVRATRPFAVVVLVTFLFSIGTNPENQLYEFAGLFLVYLLAYLPTDAFAISLHRLHASAQPRMRAARARIDGTVVVITLAIIGGFFVYAGDIAWLHLPRLWVCRALFAVTVPLLFTLGVRAFFRTRDRRLAFFPRHVALLVVPLFFFVNEALPYVGLPHMPTMTMAGNVNITAGFSDHRIVRQVPRFDFNRTVTIVKSNNARVGAGVTMPWLVFAHHLAERPNTEVTFKVDGKEEHVTRSGDDPRFQSTSWMVPLFRLGPIHIHRGSAGCGNKRQLFLINHPEKKDLLPP